LALAKDQGWNWTYPNPRQRGSAGYDPATRVEPGQAAQAERAADDRWINFPWSCEGPVVQRAGQVLDA
jgi:hypothetical protein